MFLFKKIFAPIFLPVPLCLEILIVGLLLLWFTRKQNVGKILVSIGVIFLAVLSYDFTSDNLLRPLEYRFQPLLRLEAIRDVGYVVVLGGGHTSYPQLPVTGKISASSLFRLVEGVRLYNLLPGSKLVLSGGSGFDPVPNARVMADLALAIGLPEDDLVLERTSKDTKDQARLIRGIVGKERFILVTSASHMPRSMAMFKKMGMNPIPAPTDYLVKKTQGINPGMFFPSAKGLRKAERAFYEYLGLAWANLRGQI